ncbi:thaumatin-like protein 1, partial [Corylus avellana]|uniref:thaumatin-like protein 1 n=1 Tax=Corylus avellana TaxID=13451 RepID=UPI00286D1F59
MAQLTALLVSLLTLVLSISGVISTNFTIINKCEYTVWPGILSDPYVPAMSTTGFALQNGESMTITAPNSWAGRFWGRTNCSQDSTGKFSCVTGDCGSGKIECSGNGSAMPATLAEFTLDGAGGFDFFDVSLVDGYNLPMKVVPQGGTGQNCSSAGCVADLNDLCPPELKVTSADADGNVACSSACMAFNQAKYCCTGAYISPSTCKPSIYSQIFKSACPQAYSYAYDDKTSTFSCASANYTISFCATLHNTSDTISPGQSLNTTETIVSANEIYGLGFFSPENSNKHYLVIYKYTYWGGSYDDIVWVANREHPFPNSSAILTFNSDGNLVISDGRLLHVLTHTSSGGKDTYARLLNTGNLVLTNTVSHILWQSFDYPTDTLLPGMKLKDAKTGWSLITSNTSIQDPAPGRFSLHYLASRKELIVTEESEPYWISSLTGVLADIFVIDGDYITWPSSNYTNEDIRSIRLDVSGNFILERV